MSEDTMDIFAFEGLRESRDIEAKLSMGKDRKGKIPNSLWESYSAMANTDGGTILLGVEEKADGHFYAHDLENTAGMLRDFWNTINNPEKISRNVLTDKDVTVQKVDGGKRIIQIRVPRATREQKPIYIGRNPLTGTFIRNNEGDFKCSDELVKYMIAEQRNATCDAGLCLHFDMNDIDLDTFYAYRQLCRIVNPDHVFNSRNDVEFMRQIGGWTRNRETGEEGLTAAGLLMFGKLRSILDYFPNYILDYQERPHDITEWRWVDRVTTDGSWAGNLFSFYQIVIKKLFADLKVPFNLRGSTTRIDNSPVHVAVREAFINSLIHADYSGRCSILVVKRPNMFSFRNPGTLRLPKVDIVKGGISDCRNRNLQKMFQLAGLAEQAGSGFPKIYDGWESQSWKKPELDERVDVQQTTLSLRMTSLLPSDAVEEASRELGSKFKQTNNLERLAVVTAYSEGCVNHERMMELCQEHPKDITEVLHGLVEQEMLEQNGRGRGTYYFPKGRQPQKTHFEFQANSVSSKSESSNSVSSKSESSNSVSSKSESSNSVSSNSVSSNSVSSNSVSSNSVSSNSESSNSESSNSESLKSESLTKMELREALHRQAEIARNNKKLQRAVMNALILDLCTGIYLSVEELSNLLSRETKTIRDTYVIPLKKEGKLVEKYPTSTHPDQRYMTNPSWRGEE